MSIRSLVRHLTLASFLLIPITAAAETPASMLGPGASAPAGGSTSDVTGLQPAGANPLQSTTQDSAGLTAPTQNALQGSPSSDATLRVLAGEADGAPHELSDDTSQTGLWILLTFVAVFVLLATVVVMRDRRKFARTERLHHAPHH